MPRSWNLDLARAALRGRLQERRFRRTQRHYEREARRRGLDLPRGPELRAALRRRLDSRKHPEWPRRKGELHVFLVCWIFNWEVVLPESLAPFGRVTHFDWSRLGFDPRAPDWLERRDEMNRAMLDAFHAAQREQPVDAVIGYMSGKNTDPAVLEHMAAAGAAVFNFCLDDKLRMPGLELGGRDSSPAALAHAVDLNLTNAPASLVKYAVHGGLAWFWPQGAHPALHRPGEEEFRHDVSFVGGRYGWRPVFLDRLARRLEPWGARLSCFGPGWPLGALSDESMVRVYSGSRINLGFGGVADSRRLLCLKGRDFEVPMSGGLYLTQDNPELRHVFEVGREILTYRNLDDCAARVGELLADPERAARIRRAGRARALRDHTWEKRWEQLLSLGGILEGDAYRTAPDDGLGGGQEVAP